MADGQRRIRDERGSLTWTAAVTFVVVVLAGGLVFRVGWTAQSINAKAGRIARTAVPINQDTLSVLNLDTTNKLASSINETAKPLQEKLGKVVDLARSIDGLAKSIDSSAGEVDNTAKGINKTASGIVDVARSIDRGVQQINKNLDTTIAIAQQIKADTANILSQARTAHKEAACIDKGLGGTDDGHCLQ